MAIMAVMLCGCAAEDEHFDSHVSLDVVGANYDHEKDPPPRDDSWIERYYQEHDPRLYRSTMERKAREYGFNSAKELRIYQWQREYKRINNTTNAPLPPWAK